MCNVAKRKKDNILFVQTKLFNKSKSLMLYMNLFSCIDYYAQDGFPRGVGLVSDGFTKRGHGARKVMEPTISCTKKGS